LLLYPPLKGFSHRSSPHIRVGLSLCPNPFKGFSSQKAFKGKVELNLINKVLIRLSVPNLS